MRDRPPIVAIAYPPCPRCGARLDRATLRRYGKRHDPDSGMDYAYGICSRCGQRVRVFEVLQDSCRGKHDAAASP